nr:hypothetical protein [uncultured Ralstonia sp.]
MLGFEMFDIASWAENGLTKQLPRPAHEMAAVVRRSGKWIITAAIVAAAIATPTFSTVPGSSQIASALGDISRGKTALSGEVKEGYWPALMTEMDTWKPVQVTEVDYAVDAFI